jgi:PTS system galactitol-specific IIA component
VVPGPRLVALQQDCRDWQEVLERGAQLLQAAGHVTEEWSAAVVAREREHPTGLPTLGVGVAIPHAEPDNVLRPGIAVVTLRTPVPFAVMGEEDVQVDVSVAFFLALDDGRAQLEALRRIAELAQDPDRLSRIAAAQQAEDVISAMSQDAPATASAKGET